jgi:hypothetical protein
MRVEDIPVDAIIQAARRSDIISSMKKFYAELDRCIAEQQATCKQCGKCCDFGTFGHRSYVTALEAAYYLFSGRTVPTVESDVCPHLVDNKCQARDRRTIACRIFYCAPESQEWQWPLTEEFHARLRVLHDDFNVPYFYADLMILLKALVLPDDKVDLG